MPAVCLQTRVLSNKDVVEQALRPVWGTLSEYDAVGTLCFVDALRPGKVRFNVKEIEAQAPPDYTT